MASTSITSSMLSTTITTITTTITTATASTSTLTKTTTTTTATKESLKTKLNAVPEHHPSLTIYYGNNIDILCINMSDYSKTLEIYKKALKIRKTGLHTIIPLECIIA
ncbi:unnamed protein product [Rotaria magnacalcarata]|uniref:Uncharacterized protein n=1 Tax=Rotaria magnacalcarata TaxID=392030 RepID=A0A8S2RQA4_9BILA|nr:unnamed protein product [Rotaria magnacalcarata]